MFNFFKTKDEFHLYIESLIGTKTKRIELYRTAFTHSSMSKNNNERLEFLGDSIIGAVISNLLYHFNEKSNEGCLTVAKSKIVKRSNLNAIGKRLGIQKYIKVKIPINNHSEAIIGNTFEAFVGAMFLDKGYEFAQNFLVMNIDLHVSDVVLSYKSLLIEKCQKEKIRYQFDYERLGTPQDPSFKCIIHLNSILSGEGIGQSKRDAEEEACRISLEKC